MTSGPLAGVLFVLFLMAVLALFASVIVSADRFVRSLPPPPGRKHGRVRGWFVRQLARLAHVVRTVVLAGWRAGRWVVLAVLWTGRGVVRSVLDGLQPERRTRARLALARLGHRAVEVGFGGPPDEVACQRQVRPRFEGRHPRPVVAGSERGHRRLWSRTIVPHHAVEIVIHTPVVGGPEPG